MDGQGVSVGGPDIPLPTFVHKETDLNMGPLFK